MLGRKREMVEEKVPGQYGVGEKEGDGGRKGHRSVWWR